MVLLTKTWAVGWIPTWLWDCGWECQSSLWAVHFRFCQHLVTFVVFRMALRHNQVDGRILHYLLLLWLLSCSLLQKGPSHLYLHARTLTLLPAKNSPWLSKQLSNLPFLNVFCSHCRIFFVSTCQLKHTTNMHAEKPASNPATTIFMPQNEQRNIVPPVLTLLDIQCFGYSDAFNVNNR